MALLCARTHPLVNRGVSRHKGPFTVEANMSWKSPKIVEIALGAEINSYACAETKN